MKNQEHLRKIALERIIQLFGEAEKNSSKANRYVQLARKIAMKINLRIPKQYKRKFCKHCYNYFQKGNYRIRTRNKMIIYYCRKCKKFMRFKISKI